jgi:hypothetical protein
MLRVATSANGISVVRCSPALQVVSFMAARLLAQDSATFHYRILRHSTSTLVCRPLLEWHCQIALTAIQHLNQNITHRGRLSVPRAYVVSVCMKVVREDLRHDCVLQQRYQSLRIIRHYITHVVGNSVVK